MPWYSKQLKALRKSKETSSESKKPTGHSFESIKTKGKKNFPSPVFARNRNRSKTDLP